jgi:hypothetical protein
VYTREQASLIKQAFWKAFGQYMALQPSSEGMKINWINYKTGIRHLSFKMEADNHSACIMIEMSDPDGGIRELMFEQFLELKHILNGHLAEEWNWLQEVDTEQAKTVSRISKCIDKVSVFRQEDWPALISFFKPRMVALDAFWENAQYGFDVFK